MMKWNLHTATYAPLHLYRFVVLFLAVHTNKHITFSQVSSSARAKRQMMYEQAQDKASAALRLSQQLNDMAYHVLTAKLHVNEDKRVVIYLACEVNLAILRVFMC